MTFNVTGALLLHRWHALPNVCQWYILLCSCWAPTRGREQLELFLAPTRDSELWQTFQDVQTILHQPPAST